MDQAEMNNAGLTKLMFENVHLLGKLTELVKGRRMYNMTVQAYTQALRVPVAKGCFAFMFTNIGDTIATVNGLVIFPSATPATSLGDSRTIAAHENEIYTGDITLAFQPTGGATNPNVELVQLYYI